MPANGSPLCWPPTTNVWNGSHKYWLPNTNAWRNQPQILIAHHTCMEMLAPNTDFKYNKYLEKSSPNIVNQSQVPGNTSPRYWQPITTACKWQPQILTAHHKCMEIPSPNTDSSSQMPVYGSPNLLTAYHICLEIPALNTECPLQMPANIIPKYWLSITHVWIHHPNVSCR